MEYFRKLKKIFPSFCHETQFLLVFLIPENVSFNFSSNSSLSNLAVYVVKFVVLIWKRKETFLSCHTITIQMDQIGTYSRVDEDLKVRFHNEFGCWQVRGGSEWQTGAK